MDKGIYEIQVISHVKVGGHTEYLIKIDNDLLDCHIFFTEKYTNLRNLYESIKKESKSKNFPSFPPKKLFGYEEESFVIQRAKDLNAFFQEISKEKNYSNLPSLNKFIDLNIEKNSIRKDVKTSDKQISKDIEIIIRNKRYKKRLILFGKSLFQSDKKSESRESTENFEKNFVNINYDIVLDNKQKYEEKYKSIFNNIDFSCNNSNNINFNSNNNNFNLIGQNSEYIKNEVKNINSYMKNNLDKFKLLSNLIDSDNLYLK